MGFSLSVIRAIFGGETIALCGLAIFNNQRHNRFIITLPKRLSVARVIFLMTAK